MSDDITPLDLEKALPPHLKGMATQSLADKVNNVVSDPVLADEVRKNYLSYARILQEGKWKIDDYLSAVMYVSYRLMGKTVGDSYALTFPQRYAQLVANGTSAKDISAYASAYNRGKLVNAIMEQTLVPSWVLNQDLYQKALNVQADLMVNATSEMVRTTAANSILTQLQKPKEAGPLINIDMRESSGLEELKKLMVNIAQEQQNAVGMGVTPRELAAMRLPIIEGEVVK